MDTLKIKLVNCYGIKKLENDFDFTKCTTNIIYAPNGVMKTSFAKTFKNLSYGEDSSDLIFPKRVTTREIKKEDGSDLQKEEVFVVEPYDEQFNSEKMSTLLVNKDLKLKYDKIHLKIDEEKGKLLKELKLLSGLRDEIEDEISRSFLLVNGKLFTALQRVEKEVFDSTEAEFSDILYKEIFNDKVLTFLRTKDFKDKISEYIEKYEELIDASSYFKKGVFNHNNATQIAKSLMENGFFEAEHFVSLNSKKNQDKSVIKTKAELEKVIEAEKNAILSNPDLVKAFEALDKDLNKNAELRKFRDYLESNRKIIPELKNLESFQQKLWVSYLKTQKDFYKSFLTEYQSAEVELGKISVQAGAEKTQWREVISIFNKRFSVPFHLSIENQEDVILKLTLPSIAFVFKDLAEEVSIKRDDLLKALSNGEKKALYILNIIFEVQARKQDNQQTLFIVDDIADSFDYKNKYAIIQYLKDISEDTLFRQIILTHNFDFYRTLQSRILDTAKWEYSFIAQKETDEIRLLKGGDRGITSPFEKWKDSINTDKKILIASIPFVRNLIEYREGSESDNYKKLTSLLHIKKDSSLLTVDDIKAAYTDTLKESDLSGYNATDKIIDIIFHEADEVVKSIVLSDSINLENKIILSIAIRLKAELFMWSKVTKKDEINGSQTGKLFQRYKDQFPRETESLKVLVDVNLMTPENIHLNSFMYEPILDMSDIHLKTLYAEVGKLT